MNKDKYDIDKLFDREFDIFLQKELDEEFKANANLKNNIKSKIYKNINIQEKDILMNNDICKKDNRIKTDNVSMEGINMKINNKTSKKLFKVIAASAAFILIVGNAATFSTQGKDMFTVINEINTGKISMIEEKSDVDETQISMNVPNELKGQIFDENGKEVSVLTKENEGHLYDKNGNKITGYSRDEKNGKMELNFEGENKKYLVSFSSIEDAAKYLKFKPLQIQGLKIKKIELYKDENGKISPECIDILYKADDGDIFIQQRYASKENRYSGSGENIKEVDINGSRGIMSSGNSVDWEFEDKLIGVHSDSNQYKDENLLNLCRNLK